MGVDGRMRYSVPIEWIGLRPSDVDGLKCELPGTVFQKLTDLDTKRIASLLDTEKNSNNPFLTHEDGEEIELMKKMLSFLGKRFLKQKIKSQKLMIKLAGGHKFFLVLLFLRLRGFAPRGENFLNFSIVKR